MLNMSSILRSGLGLLWGVLTFGAVSGQTPSVDRSAKDRDQPVTAIVGATVIDGTGAPPLVGATVLLRGSRIDAVGREEAIRVPPGATVLDGRGLFVIPGLIDAGFHVTNAFTGDTVTTQLNQMITFRLRDALRTGVTTLRDTYGLLTPLRAVRDSIRTGRRLGARLLIAGEIFGYGAPPVAWDDSLHPVPPLTGYQLLGLSPDSLRTRVRQHLDRGVDFIRYGTARFAGEENRGEFSEEAQRIIVEEAHKRGLMVETHASSADGLRAALKAGVDLVQYPHILQKSDRTPLLVPDDIVQLFASRPVICTASGPMYGSPEEVEVYKTNFWKLKAAGCLVAVATDGGVMPPALQSLMSMTVTGLELVVAATRNGARAAGMLDQLGTLEPGKIADLVVSRVDPQWHLDQLEPSIAMVFKEGKRVDVDQLRRVISLQERLGKMFFEAEFFGFPFPGEGATPKEQEANRHQRQQELSRRLERLPVLTVIDSLAAAPNPAGVQQRLVELVADHFGVLWTMLTPAQRTAMEPRLRRWMEYRAAAGTPVTIPGLP